MQNKNVKVALIQAGSVVMDLDASVQKAVDYIIEAGKEEADLIVFPEAFISGYPRGMDFGTKVGDRKQRGREDFRRYSESAISIPSPEIDAIAEASKKASAYTSIGVIEKEPISRGGTLYCTVLFFSPEGELIGKHRKLKPTGSERLIWGEGDGSTLPVINTPFGNLGALICWENYMPLARAAMYEKGVQIYIAPTADARDTWFSSMQHIALEGRCFVLSCNQYSTKSMYPEDLQDREEIKTLPEELTRGGSCIVDPLGNFIHKPTFGEETVIYAELDLSKLSEAKFDFDVVGHYARADIFQLTVDETEKTNVVFKKD